jgi:hypothetical protein
METNHGLDPSRVLFRHLPTGKPRCMATKTRRIRRIGGIAIGAVKTIFRTGKAWGTTRTRVATVRRPRTVASGAALAVGAAGGAAGAYFLMRRRRSNEEAEERVDATTVQMAAGNGAGGPVPAKEAVASGS